jgi:membrane fusion protein (multidrug efflux system)
MVKKKIVFGSGKTETKAGMQRRARRPIMASLGSDPKREKEENAIAVGRRGPRVVLMVLLLAVVLAAAVFYYFYSRTRVRTDNAYVHATIYPISARIPGTVLEVRVEDNEIVESNQSLVRLDPEDLSLKVRMASAALASARTQHEEAQIGLKAARAEDRLAEDRLSQAKLDLSRAEALWNKRSISKEQFDRAVTQHRVLSAQRLVTQAQIGASEARIISSETNLENAEAQLAHAELMLSYTEIRSPSRGYVSQKSVEAGKVVQPGAPLMAVVDLEDTWIEANYKEIQLGRIRPGQEAEVRLDIFPKHLFHGHVESIHAGTGAAFSLFPPENATGNWVKIVQRVPVKIALDGYAPGEDTPLLRVGMSAEVTVYPQEKPSLPWPLSSLSDLL